MAFGTKLQIPFKVSFAFVSGHFFPLVFSFSCGVDVRSWAVYAPFLWANCSVFPHLMFQFLRPEGLRLGINNDRLLNFIY